MLIKLLHTWYLLAALSLVQGCHPDTSTPPSPLPEPDTEQPLPVQAAGGHVTDTMLTCMGIFEIPRDEYILISPQAPGRIRSILCAAGDYVKKGTILAVIENADFLKLQQDYLVAQSQLSFYSGELKRQGELTIENATSMKKLQQAQLDYEVWEARYHGLAAQLTLAGFNPDSVDIYNLSPVAPVTATDSGYISRVSATEGKSYNPGDRLFQIVKDNRPVLVMDIPEEYYGRIRTGQNLEFTLPTDTSVVCQARITCVHNAIDPVTHCFRANAVPTGRQPSATSGMRFNAKLYTGRPESRTGNRTR